MKNIFKKLLYVIIISMIFTVFNDVKAFEVKKDNKMLEMYEIKPKEDLLVEDTKILDFYKSNSNIQLEEKEEEIIEEEVIEEIVIPPVGDLNLATNIVNFSLQFIGNPYVSGGTSLTDGTDCSGFVQSVFANFGVYLPRTTYEQSITGVSVPLENIEIGDIISYGYDGYVSHSALYIGNGMIIHASTPELGIRLDSIYIMPIVSVRRVI